jgi:hypothetical protein
VTCIMTGARKLVSRVNPPSPNNASNGQHLTNACGVKADTSNTCVHDRLIFSHLCALDNLRRFSLTECEMQVAT